MTPADLTRIEATLTVQLPIDYRTLMTAYPFALDSFVAECLLPDNADWIIETNRGRASSPWSSVEDDVLGRSYFMIGADGGEEAYLIDLSVSESPVYVYQYETGKIRRQAAGLQDFVAECRAAEDEIRRDEEAAKQRSWWRFWR